MDVKREGILYKWTNYISGWQERFFKLEGDVLSYYRSQSEVDRGCRGSIKLSACKLSVHAVDQCRIDLSIPSQGIYYYLRAQTPRARQEWLVSFSTAKACLTNPNSCRSDQQPHHERTEALRQKLSEMRLFADILTQQVSIVRQLGGKRSRSDEADDDSIDDSPFSNEPSSMSLDEAGCLLEETCSTFITTVNELCSLADYQLSPIIDNRRRHRNGRHSDDSFDHVSANGSAHRNFKRQSLPEFSDGEQHRQGGLESRSRTSSASSIHSSSSDTESSIKTFFEPLVIKFGKIASSNDILLTPLIDGCSSFVLFFDVLYYTILPPIKSGISSNAKRLQAAVDSHGFTSLSAVLDHEQKQQTINAKHSCTQCLIWLHRDLNFMREFFCEMLTGESNLTTAATHSYSKTLRSYNGWVVRGVYNVAFKSLPFKSELISALCKTTESHENEAMERAVLKDMDRFTKSLSQVLSVLQNLLKTHNIIICESTPVYNGEEHP